jgi:hypothetical protein
VNVRVKGCAVNSVFLVQLRKIVGRGFRGSAGMENLFEDVVLSRAEGSRCVCGGASSVVLGEWGQGIVHRGCTGNAESSGQWLVVSGQLLVSGLVENHGRRRRLNSCGAVRLPVWFR